MTRLDACLLLLSAPLALVAAGYGWTARLEGSALLRLGTASLVGLASLMFSSTVVNAAVPLAGIWAWVCYLPWLYPFSRSFVRRQLLLDLRTLATMRTIVLSIGAAGFLCALLWPVICRPSLVFYDGSANHDAFFWIVNAEHLQRSSYMISPVADVAHPLFYPAAAISGIAPAWGRLGAEELLAVLSSVCGLSPLKLYLAATAALFIPWLAAVFLILRTFFTTKPFGVGAVAIVLFQPLFVFFHANANLPNLVGAMICALLVAALARSLRDTLDWSRWCLILPITTHALLCSYPEMIPVAMLSAVCLCARRCFGSDGFSRSRTRVIWTIAAVLAGFALNPITSIRAGHGFIASFGRLDNSMARQSNVFHGIAWFGRLPAITLLSPTLGHDLSWALLGIACTAVLAAGMWIGLRAAHDRYGALACLAGVPVILGVTVTAGFGYGWQKTVQFSAVPIAALLAASALVALSRMDRNRGWGIRTIGRTGGLAVLALCVYATGANFREVYKWSHRKFITQEWFAAQNFSRTHLRNATIVVDSREFDYPFFYTMWSAYFLTDSRIRFSGDRVSGGYLRTQLDPYEQERFAPARAALVSLRRVGAEASAPLWVGADIAFVAPQALREIRTSETNGPR